jgi:predicted alpha/beta-hydrolase family hydrolase
MPETIAVEYAPGQKVTATRYPAEKRHAAGITLILAHGAGAGQGSPFMVSCASALAERGIACVTFNFPYIEQRRRIPDSKEKLEGCYRAVVAAVAQHLRGRGRLAIGGKSMGGRIASQIAASDLPEVGALVFLGYPLHPPGKKDQLRDKHLPAIKAPMLFVQGERDAFGTPAELQPIIDKLKVPVELFAIVGGDHSFKIPKKADVPQEAVHASILDRIDHWLRATLKA